MPLVVCRLRSCVPNSTFACVTYSPVFKFRHDEETKKAKWVILMFIILLLHRLTLQSSTCSGMKYCHHDLVKFAATKRWSHASSEGTIYIAFRASNIMKGNTFKILTIILTENKWKLCKEWNILLKNILKHKTDILWCETLLQRIFLSCCMAHFFLPPLSFSAKWMTEPLLML